MGPARRGRLPRAPGRNKDAAAQLFLSPQSKAACALQLQGAKPEHGRKHTDRSLRARQLYGTIEQLRGAFVIAEEQRRAAAP